MRVGVDMFWFCCCLCFWCVCVCVCLCVCVWCVECRVSCVIVRRVSDVVCRVCLLLVCFVFLIAVLVCVCVCDCSGVVLVRGASKGKQLSPKTSNRGQSFSRVESVRVGIGTLAK